MFYTSGMTYIPCDLFLRRQRHHFDLLHETTDIKSLTSNATPQFHHYNSNAPDMSGRVLFARVAPLARRRLYNVRPVNRRNPYPLGAYSLHNVPATRPISFVRVLPKLVQKFAVLGAAGAGATVAGLVYIQNQATAAGNWIAHIFNQAKDGTANAAGEAYEGAASAFDQIRRGWRKTKDRVEIPEWMHNIMMGKERSSEGGGQGSHDPKNAGVGVAAAGAATSATFGTDENSEEDESAEIIARDEQMMMLTKKMIHIRSLLQTVGQSESLTLPSIVVIGSQSSGKSSVLEAIVGHEFLPKGNNMVTRRPIELTLVNTPDSSTEYGEFPTLGLGKITDFGYIQKTLTDLNLAVPAKDCVSDDPIQLRIYSPNVPDLSLIDLPGYIQVTSNDQPPELKQKIIELCEKYIQPPNVILAISAADVDLANSTSLRASRKVDARGERTIGVITKMDLVDPQRGVELLTDKKYPLRLGYVGVVCKMPHQSTGHKLFKRGSGANMTNAIVRNENAFFSSHPLEFGPESQLDVGTQNLRKKLIHVLEQTMAASLKSTSEVIHQELAEATYEFKVQYNERPLSAETYLAESLDAFKHSFRGFAESFGREQIRELLKHELDQQVLNLLAMRYWNKPNDDMIPVIPEVDELKDLPKAEPDHPLWHLKLDASSANLTKLGIGRLATTVVASALQEHVDRLIANSSFENHPFARRAITEASSIILRDLSYDISDELEICIKPYKYRIELDDAEWVRGRDNIAKVLKEELRVCENAIHHVEEQVGGRRKLKDVMGFIDRVRTGQVVLEGDGVGGAGGFSAALLWKGIFHGTSNRGLMS